MLKKLIKYELLSVSKIYLSLYSVIIGLAILNKIFNFSAASDMSTPGAILMVAYIMLITAMAVITVIIGVNRFTQNLLSDEGYLMFTLPVKRSELIISKVATATIWSIVGGVVAILSIFILIPFEALQEFFTDFFSKLIPFLVQYAGSANLIFYIIEILILIMIAVVPLYMLIYLSLAMGHTFKKNKMLASFGCFFVISFITQSITTLVFNAIDWNLINSLMSDLPINAATHLVMVSSIISIIITSSIYFFATNYILVKKLNLE